MNHDALNEFLKRDLYQILGVSKTATKKDIEDAYQKLKEKYSSDSKEFQEVSYAYNILMKSQRRYNNLRAKLEEENQEKKEASLNEKVQKDSPSSEKYSNETEQQNNQTSQNQLLAELTKIEMSISLLNAKIASLKKSIQVVDVKFGSKAKNLEFQENGKVNVLLSERNRKLREMSAFSKIFNKRRVNKIYEECHTEIRALRKSYRAQKEELENEWQEEKEKAIPQNEIYQKEISLYQLLRKQFEQKRDQINMQLYGAKSPEFEKDAKKAV